MTYDEIE